MAESTQILQEKIAELNAKCEQYEAWMQTLGEHADFDVWFKDQNSRYLFVNKHFAQSMGTNVEALSNKQPYEIFDYGRAQRIESMDQKIMREGELKRVVPCDESGQLEMHHETRFPVKNAQGETIGVGCFAHDISKLNTAEHALSTAESLAKIGNWRWSIVDQCLISCSQGFADLLGCSIKDAFELMGKRLETLVHPEDRDHVANAIKQQCQDDCKAYRVEYRIILPNNEVRHVLEIAEPLLGNAGKPVEYAGTLQDVTCQKSIEHELAEAKAKLERRVEERNKNLHYMATHDNLTGLINRVAYYEKVQQRLAESSGIGNSAIVVLDLDGFKHINDCFGHAAGDHVLKIIANRLRSVVNESGIVARMGGDEFALALFDLKNPRHNIEQLFNRIYQIISHKIVYNQLELFVGCSAGIRVVRDQEDDLDDLIANADMALYKAKENKSEKHVFYQAEMGADLAYRKRLEIDLAAAIQAQQLFVVYQPQFKLNNIQLSGVEALVRWTHPEFGPISPTVFVPIAEECGLMDQLSNFVLDRACRDFATFTGSIDPDFRVAVNFSPVQFFDPYLIEKIEHVLNKYDLSPSFLEIEITESLFVKNADHAKQILDEMRRMGLRIALDDFGTGYSALSYLREFDVDCIKLDRSFISGMHLSGSNKRLVEGIVRLAHSLGLTVIGEGVETPLQGEFLKNIGCQFAQGFYYAKPMTAYDLQALYGIPTGQFLSANSGQ